MRRNSIICSVKSLSFVALGVIFFFLSPIARGEGEKASQSENSPMPDKTWEDMLSILSSMPKSTEYRVSQSMFAPVPRRIQVDAETIKCINIYMYKWGTRFRSPPTAQQLRKHRDALITITSVSLFERMLMEIDSFDFNTSSQLAPFFMIEIVYTDARPPLVYIGNEEAISREDTHATAALKSGLDGFFKYFLVACNNTSACGFLDE